MTKRDVYQKFPYPNLGKVMDGVLYVLQYVELVLGRPVNKVLDIGCGTGEYLMSAARRNSKVEFLGVDFSESAIKIAEGYKKKLKLKNVELRCVDIRDVTTVGVDFDYIVCSGLIESIDDIDLLGVVMGFLSDCGVLSMNVRGRYGVGEDIQILKDIVRSLTSTEGVEQTRVFEELEILKKIWFSVHEDHWIRKIFVKELIEDDAFMVSMLLGDNFSVLDVFNMLKRFDLKFVDFVDGHLWIPEFHNLQDCLEDLSEVKMYEMLSMLRRDSAYFEFFVTNCKEYKRKNWRIDPLVTSPLGTIMDNSFLFYDGTSMTLDKIRAMILKYLREPHTLKECGVYFNVDDAVRKEMEGVVLEEFIEVMFNHKVLV